MHADSQMRRISCLLKKTSNTLPSKDSQEHNWSNDYIILLGREKKAFCTQIWRHGVLPFCTHFVLIGTAVPPLYSTFQFTAPSAATSAVRPMPVEKRAREIEGKKYNKDNREYIFRKLTDFTICGRNVNNVKSLRT